VLILFCLGWNDVSKFYVFEGAGEAANTFICKFDDAIRDGEQGVVLTDANVFAGTNFGAALSNENVTTFGEFTGVELGSEALALGISSVTGRTAGFFMGHTGWLRKLICSNMGRDYGKICFLSRREKKAKVCLIMPKTNVELRQEIEKVLDILREGIAMHAGNVELVDVDTVTGKVSVRFQGTCVGCPMSDMTLKAGIEDTLREMVPEVTEVIAVP